jgi:predicted MFS family arabinose efflux permease
MLEGGAMFRRDVARVLASETVSNFGSMLSRLAIPWLAALSLHASPLQMALLLVADVLAAAIGSVLLGVWVDRSRKRRIMLTADGVRFVLLLSVAAGAWYGVLSFALLVVVAAGSGLATMAFELARSAWMAQHILSQDLPRRNSQLSAATSLSETAAFALGGWLYQWLGAAWSLVIDAVSFVGSAVCLWTVRENRAIASNRSSARPWRMVINEAADGVKIIWQSSSLRTLAVVEVLLAFSIALNGTSYMIFVSRDVGIPTGTLGMIFALGGLGSLVGAGLAPKLGDKLGRGWTITIGLAAYAFGCAFVPIVTMAGWGAVGCLIVHQVIADAGHTVQNVHGRTLRQLAAPEQFLARVDAGIRTAEQVAILAGALAGGYLGSAMGTRSVLWLAAAFGLIATAVALVFLDRFSHAQRS